MQKVNGLVQRLSCEPRLTASLLLTAGRRLLTWLPLRPRSSHSAAGRSPSSCKPSPDEQRMQLQQQKQQRAHWARARVSQPALLAGGIAAGVVMQPLLLLKALPGPWVRFLPHRPLLLAQPRCVHYGHCVLLGSLLVFYCCSDGCASPSPLRRPQGQPTTGGTSFRARRGSAALH